MASRKSWLTASLKRHFPHKASSDSRSVPWPLLKLQRKQSVKQSVASVGSCSITNPKSWWAVSEPRKHSGPKARIHDPFQRKDEVHLKLAAQQLEWYETPPLLYHDLLAALAKVGRLEKRINYTFKDKMMCVEALKVTSSMTPMFFKGIIYKVDRNNRLALLGDRVLKLALCEIWFHTGNSPGSYTRMYPQMESRASLSAKGLTLGIDKVLLLPEGVDRPKYSQIAESLEAIIGAVYLDSGKSIEVVKKFISDIKHDDHKFLRPHSRSRYIQKEKELRYHRAEKILLHEKTSSLKREALALQKEVQDGDAFITKQQGDKSTIGFQIQMTTETKAKSMEHEATAFQNETKDVGTLIEEELRNNLGIDTQMQSLIKRHVEYLQNGQFLSRKKENDLASSEIQQGDKLQTRVSSRKNVADGLRPVESLLLNDPKLNDMPTIAAKQQNFLNFLVQGQSSTKAAKEPAVQISKLSSTVEVASGTAESPASTSATILDLVKKIEAFNRRASGIASKRARRRWRTLQKKIRKEAWDAATKQALSLQYQHLPANAQQLFEQSLEEKLEAALAQEQDSARNRDIMFAQKQSRAPKGPKQSGFLGVEKDKASHIAQKDARNQKELESRGTKASPLHNRLEQDVSGSHFPKRITPEVPTRVGTPVKAKKVLARKFNKYQIKRQPKRRAGS